MKTSNRSPLLHRLRILSTKFRSGMFYSRDSADSSRLFMVLLFVITIIAYHTSFVMKDYVMDDAVAVKKNPLVVGDLNFREFWRRDFWGLELFAGTWTHKSFRPFTTLTYRWGYLLHGLGNSGFHITNLLLHLLASWSVGWLAKVVMDKTTEGSNCQRSNYFWALVSGGFFALHPVHTENVLYLVGRADILATIFGCLGIGLYLSDFPCLTNSEMFRSVFRLSAILTISGLCKETGFMLMGVAGGIELLDLLRGAPNAPRSPEHAREKSSRPFVRFLFVFILSVLLLWARHGHTSGTEINMSVQDNPVGFEISRFVRIPSYALIHGYYLRLLVWPIFLCYDYSLNAIPLVEGFTDVRLLLPLAGYSAVALILYTGVALMKSNMFGWALLVSLGWFCLSFLPATNILFPVATVIGERLLYLPSVGLCIGLAIIGSYWDGLANKVVASDPLAVKIEVTGRVSIARISAITLIGLLAIRTGFRANDWVDGDTLFLRDGLLQPHSAKSQFNVGVTQFMRQNWEESLKAFIECAKADPMSALPYWRIGQIEIFNNRFETAEAYLMEASTKFGATLMVRDEEIFHDLAVALFQLGKKARAEWYLGLSLELNTRFPKGLNNMGCLLANKGSWTEAINKVKTAVELSPQNMLYLNNLQLIAKIAGQEKVHKGAQQRLTALGGANPNHKDCIWEFSPAS